MREELDKILFEIEDKGYKSFSKHTLFKEERAVQKLLRLGLVFEINNNTYDLTSEGQKAVDLGGYEKWRQQEELDNQKDKQIKDLTIKQLKGSVFQLKYWWLLLLISAIVGFITGNFSTIVSWFK